MAVDKKYYWLKLKEDFFEEDTLQWLEEQPNGKDYCLFYLKLCLKSLRNNGILIRNVGNMLIPYDVKKLSEITRTEIDTVRVAMECFKKIGLVEILDNGEIYLTQLENMVGSETKWAKYKQKQRKLENVQNRLENVQTVSNDSPKNVHTEKEIDIEQEIDIEKEIEKEIKEKGSSGNDLKEIYPYLEQRGFTTLSPNSIQMILEDIKIYSIAEVKKAIDIADENGKHTYSYVRGILERRKAGYTGKKKNENKSKFFNFESHDYDYDDLEKKLLGWDE